MGFHGPCAEKRSEVGGNIGLAMRVLSVRLPPRCEQHKSSRYSTHVPTSRVDGPKHGSLVRLGALRIHTEVNNSSHRARCTKSSQLTCSCFSFSSKFVERRTVLREHRTIRHTPSVRQTLCFLFFVFFTHIYFPASGQAVVTGVVPFPHRFLPSVFIAHRVQQSHCSSIFHRVLPTHALALSASQFVHKKKFPPNCTTMHSWGFELTKLTCTRLEDNLIRHRGDRSTLYTPPGVQISHAPLPKPLNILYKHPDPIPYHFGASSGRTRLQVGLGHGIRYIGILV